MVSLNSLLFLSLSMTVHVLSFKPVLEDKFPGHDEITVETLYDHQFCSKTNDYISKIRKANRDVDLGSGGSPEAHCANEKLLECSTRVINLANGIIPFMDQIEQSYNAMMKIADKFGNLTGPQRIETLQQFKEVKNTILDQYNTLAERVGTALHTVQDFYSHSNFVEKDAAGERQKLITFDTVIPSPDISARYCPQDSSVIDPRVNGYTSGYEGKDAPTGKCIHGSETTGINKNTPNKKNYNRAVRKASSASVEFIQNILKKLPSDLQKDLFRGCITIPTLANAETFGAAIDVTGSMGTAINEVKAWINKFILSGEVLFGKYVMVLFNDPEVDEAKIYYDAREFLTAVNAISVNGGGDCPEMMYTGIEKLAKVIDKDSSLYVFSDADAKDLNTKREIVHQLVKENNLKLNFILTGSCGSPSGRRRRSLTGLEGKTSTRIDADILAETSGGVVVDSKPEEVSTSLEIARRVQTIKTTTIKSGSIPNTCTNVTFSILQKGSNVSIVLRHSLSTILSPADRCAIYGPSGSRIEPTSYMQTLRTSMITLKKIAEIGDWTMTFCYSADYQISSDENIKVTIEILDYVNGNHEKILFPIESNPLVDKTYRFTLQVESSDFVDHLVNDTLQLSMVDKDGRNITSVYFEYKLVNTSIAGTRAFSGHIQIPQQTFYLAITGKTKDGVVLQRYSSKITPDWIQVIPEFLVVEVEKSREENSPVILQFSLDSKASSSYDLTLLPGVSKGSSFIQTVRLLNSSALSLQSNTTVNVFVEVVAHNKTFCSQNDVDTENTEIFLSASSPILTVSSNVIMKLPCIANVTLPKGCIYTEKLGECGRDKLQPFEITIVQHAEAGGVPCPEPLTGKKACESATPPSKGGVHYIEMRGMQVNVFSMRRLIIN
jgi:hypothetical protein